MVSERDIVERLLEGTHIRDDVWVNPTPLAKEAAAEILRLRAQVAEWQSRAEAAANAVPPQADDVTWALSEVRRAGWIAGRDAAAEVLTGVHGSAAPLDPVSWRLGVEDGLTALRKAIRNMEPPA